MGKTNSKKKWNLIFWAVQISGWLGITIFSYTVALNFKDFGNSNFNIFSNVLTFLVGIITTGLLRSYLNRTLDLKNFDFKQLLKFTLGTLVTGSIYFAFTFGSGFLVGYFSHKGEALKVPKAFDVGIGLIVFSSLLVIFGWAILYLAIRIIIDYNANRLEKSELNSSLKQAQLNTLKGQINPHFMFNSLNNIRGLMLEDVEKSREMLTKLSEMLRYSLTKDDTDSIPVEEELEMVDNYIELSKIQFENRLNFIKDIEPKTLTMAIPPMIIQLLIENAIKHGISNIKQGGNVILKVNCQVDKLNIQVRNSGKLSISKNSTRLGLKNIQQRLRLLYGNKAVFTLNEVDQEVVADIKIPLL